MYFSFIVFQPTNRGRVADTPRLPPSDRSSVAIARRREVAPCSRPTRRVTAFMGFVPTKARLEQFDGFCVSYQDCELRNICGYQCKDNKRGADDQVPAWITQGGHLLRSDAPTSCKANGHNLMGWTYYNGSDTDKLFGWSLRVMRTRG
jgi:hypothetical protein